MSLIERGEIIISCDDQASAKLNTIAGSTTKVGNAAATATPKGAGFAGMLGKIAVPALAAAGALAGAYAAFEKVKVLVERGAQVSDVAGSFKSLGGNISEVRNSVNGLMSDFDAMRAFNLAATLGLTNDQFKILAEYADLVADKFGTDMAGELEKLTQAIGTGKTAPLKRLGLEVEESGTKAQKTSRLLAVMSDELMRVGESGDSAGDALDRMNAAQQNLNDRMAETISNSQSVISLQKDLKIFMDDWSAFTNDFLPDLVWAVADVAKKIDNLLFNTLIPDYFLTNVDFEMTLEKIRKGRARIKEELLSGQSGVEYGAFFGDSTVNELQSIDKELDGIVIKSKKAAEGIGKVIKSGQAADNSVVTFDQVDFEAAPQLTTAEAMALREQEIAWDNAHTLIGIQEFRNQALYDEQKASQEQLESISLQFASMFAGTWAAMWQEIAAGSGFDTILKMFLDMIGNMAIQLGNMVMLAGIALQTVPIFGNISGSAAIAAGLALTAFGGIVKGLASQIGGSESKANSGGNTYGGGYSGNSVTDSSARNITINVDASGSLDTADSISAKVMKAWRHADAMGY